MLHRLPCLQLADSNHPHALRKVHVTRHDLLQGHNCLSRSQCCVNTGPRHRAVRLTAFNVNLEGVGRIEGRALRHQHFAGRYSGHHMDAVHLLDAKLFKHSVFNQCTSARELWVVRHERIGYRITLFGRLEDKHDLARDVSLVCGQDAGSRQQHRHVHVMTAYVRHVGRFAPHLSFGFTFKGKSCVFFDRQGINVCPQADGISFLRIDHADDGRGRILITNKDFVHTEFLELLNDVGLGLLFLIAKLRIGMQMAAHLHSMSRLGADSRVKPRRRRGKGACRQKRQAGKGKNAQCFFHRSLPIFQV